MENIQGRLKEYVSTQGLAYAQFEKLCGLSNGSAAKISCNVRKSTIDRISNGCPNLNTDWLLTGEGTMLKSKDMIALKRFRGVNKLTQAEVAEYLGVSPPFITNIEKGNNKMPQDKLASLLHNPHGWDTSMFIERNGTWLKEFRLKNDISQMQLAEFLGVGQGFVSQMEKGGRKVPDTAIEKIMCNPHGWDTSMLMEKSSISMNGTNFVGVAGDVHNGEGRTEQYIKSLQDTIARLEKEKADYWELIVKLSTK